MAHSISDNLLNDYQHTFPLVSEPFRDLARDLGSDVDTVLSELKTLRQQGAISRVGPVFRPNTVGVSTLAAITVPADEIEHHAEIINRFPQVNHNYEREHEINLWFVLTASNQAELEHTIEQIEEQTGYEVLVLPLLKEYHIDLGFNLHHLGASKNFSEQALLRKLSTPTTLKARELDSTRELIAAIQDGLPLVERPYQALAEQLGLSEEDLIESLRRLIESGTIKRFGVVVRHHEIGYQANAMVVWNVLDDEIDQLGARLGEEHCVTLCYQRPRVLPRWPYNLFCMIHGRSREEVMSCIDGIRKRHALSDIEHDILFSTRRFKQRGARYGNAGRRAKF